MECSVIDIVCNMSAFQDWIMSATVKLYSDMLDGCISVLESIAVVPDINPAAILIPDGVMFFSRYLELGFGIKTLIAAYGVRFVIRRIPFIG